MKRPSIHKHLPLMLLLLFSSVESYAESVTATTNATTLTNSLSGSGVTVSGEVLTGTDASQSGTFTGFNFLTNNEMDDGVLLSTGNVADLVNGPPTTNLADDTGTEFNPIAVNDGDLGNSIFDPVKLTFNVTPQYDTLIIDFMFGSDEYTEYVNGGYNDKMRIIVNGTDCALTPDLQVFSIDSVNTTVNAPLFNNNDLNDGGASFASEMDGFTRVLSCRVTVTPNVSIPIVIGVSDDGDADFDSWAFFRAQSLRSEPCCDLGDAPDTYGTLIASSGARHGVVEGVYIGSKPTGEADGFVDGIDDSGGTASDDTNDDGVSSFPLLTDVTTSYSVTVSATSINGNNSNLIGWIDFDGDGAFQADEASNVATVTSGTFESPVVLTWNNIGSSGPDIALGDTFVRLRITNSAIAAANTGGTYATGEVEDYAISVTDGVPPVVVITSAPTATVANSATYPVSGTCTAGDGNVTVSIAGATPGSQGVACSGGGTWSATFDVSAIGDGSNVIDVNASQTDAASNTGNATLVEANKDATAPSVVITSAPVVTAANAATYPVSGTCSAGDGNVTVSIAGATPGSQDVACSGGGAWSATFNVSAIGDGPNVIDVNANQTDAAGNTGNATLVEANKDATLPVVAITSAPSVTVANAATYPVSGTCSAGDGNVTVSIAGATPGSQGVACSGGGTWSATFDVSAIGDGTNVIDVNASQTDGAGNTGNAVLVEANKDTTVPVVATTSAPTATAANAATYPVSGTCTAGDGNVTVSIAGATPGSQGVACSGGGTWSATFDVSAIGDGPNVIDVNASQTDGAGNTGNATLVEANKDATVPTVGTTSAPTATATNAATYPVSGTCSAGDGNVTVNIAGATPGSQGVACSGGGTWSATFDVSAIGDGSNVIDVNASQTDAAGNTGNATLVEASKDTVGPSVAILSAPTSVATLAPFNVTFEFNEDVTSFILGDIAVGNGSASNFVAVDGNTYTADITPNGSGDITINVSAGVAQDTGGNDNSAATQVTITLVTDTDSDGIPDSVECPSGPPFNALTCAGDDTDSDGTPDFQDLDSDGDSVPDSVEAGSDPNNPVDTDSDGTPDFQDLDSDNDAIPDSVEAGSDPNNPVDTDSDGTPDYLDLDSDGDAIPDSVEAGSDPNNPVDTDSDGTPDYQDLDAENDGIPDTVEGGASGTDTDSDGIDDAYDVDQTGGTDTNGDGIDDNAAPDTDSDGTPDFQDPDADGDGMPDAVEAGSDPNNPLDMDGDGTRDFLDLDSDGDGVADAAESGASGTDTDGDDIDDAYDVDQTGGTDANGDGIDDAVTALDSNNDGIPDYQDATDSDGDGLVNTLDIDDDNDGILDSAEGNETVDTDGDGVADSLDLDSDNDGLFDLDESGATVSGLDSDNDGRIDSGNTVGSNGMADVLETGADSGSANYALIDTDSDSVHNFRDLDSDGDGLYDLVEAGGSDADNNGRVDGLNDLDGDGLHDPLSGSGLPNPDTDGDSVVDVLDLDSDNDGIYDVMEAGGGDLDGDGLLGNSPQSVDANGVATGSGLSQTDTDSDGVVDRLDLDSDNDGIPDVTDAGGSDPDGDGQVGSGTPVVDVNGVTSGPILPGDADSDGTPNHLDSDADGDGLLDIIEAGGFDIDSDGLVDGLSDGNGDGLDDLIAASPLPLPDSDGDTIPDFLDNDDQDNDGVPDSVDLDLDNDGIPNNLEGDGSVDTDGDGVPDSIDLDSDNDGIYDLHESGADAALLDGDSDGRIDGTLDVGSNGLADGVETGADSGSISYNGGVLRDTDSDGVADFRDLDSDNDGLYDVTETGGSDPDGDGVVGNGTPTVNGDGEAPGAGQPVPDTDGDGVTDPRDVDRDNDGVTDTLEAGGSDPDGDGQVGSGTPSVDPNTGVPLVGAGLIDVDTDGDGTPDTQDTDSDGDGVTDLEESGVGAVDTSPQDGMVDAMVDTNGNGWDDSLEGLLIKLPDSDSDGIPDLKDDTVTTSETPLQTGLNGVGGCALGRANGFDPLLPLLAILSLTYLGWRRRQTIAIRVKSYVEK
ncbi:MAG: choice-of-anchor L domain-containing protein [Candidatus Thiodiazotropha sp. (ex Myrtea sp. 'scaly one' KF741663)]|nr:choice-of-anchor L domain-containing protein [Candidatus Thiodiazotropha sp. (ex Myrtea sp. 'scaly one' KF741663)]